MQEITTVRVGTILIVNKCSHSDTEPYKNLPQSACTETTLLQLGPPAGAEGEETVTQNTGPLNTELNKPHQA